MEATIEGWYVRSLIEREAKDGWGQGGQGGEGGGEERRGRLRDETPRAGERAGAPPPPSAHQCTAVSPSLFWTAMSAPASRSAVTASREP